MQIPMWKIHMLASAE